LTKQSTALSSLPLARRGVKNPTRARHRVGCEPLAVCLALTELPSCDLATTVAIFLGGWQHLRVGASLDDMSQVKEP